jgi:hypothetical protein
MPYVRDHAMSAHAHMIVSLDSCDAMLQAWHAHKQGSQDNEKSCREHPKNRGIVFRVLHECACFCTQMASPVRYLTGCKTMSRQLRSHESEARQHYQETGLASSRTRYQGCGQPSPTEIRRNFWTDLYLCPMPAPATIIFARKDCCDLGELRLLIDTSKFQQHDFLEVYEELASRLVSSSFSAIPLVCLVLVRRTDDGRPLTDLDLPPCLTLDAILTLIATNSTCLAAPICTALMQEL